MHTTADQPQTPAAEVPAPAAAPAAEEKKPPHTRIHGQHVFFTVKGTSSDAAYEAAKQLGVKLLEFKRLRANVPGITVEKEIEVADPNDKTKTVKKKVQVLAAMQPGVYRKLPEAEVNRPVQLPGTVEADGDAKADNKLGLQVIAETEFTYIVKAMGDPSETLE